MSRPARALRRVRWLFALAAIAILGFLGVIDASAHADIIAADPAPGSTVSGSPTAINLSFSQPLLASSRLDLFTGQFRPVPGVTTLVAGSQMRGVLARPLSPATYTVQWTAVSDDGHATQGSYQFAVVQASTPLAARMAPIVAAAAAILCGAVALLAWFLNRRQRL